MNPLTEPTPELRALAQAMRGRPTPCMSDPDLWFDQPHVAATRCLDECHALRECDAYAAATRPDHGVWAGGNYDRKPSKRGRSA